MTDVEITLNLLELAGAHSKSMNPGMREGFGTTEEVLARFEAYRDALRNSLRMTRTEGAKETADV